jgi:hypothetical protein
MVVSMMALRSTFRIFRDLAVKGSNHGSQPKHESRHDTANGIYLHKILAQTLLDSMFFPLKKDTAQELSSSSP